MSVLFSRRLLFFIHIPKCAGTSFSIPFDRVLRPEGRFWWHGLDGDFNFLARNAKDIKFSNSPSNSRGITFVGGHFTIDSVELFLRSFPQDGKFKIISIIRDPIEQAKSYFNWITYESNKKGAPHPLFYATSKMNILDFLASESTLKEVKNIQTRYLLGSNYADSTSESIRLRIRELQSLDSFSLFTTEQAQLGFNAACDFLQIDRNLFPSDLGRLNQSTTSAGWRFPTVSDKRLNKLISKHYASDIEIYHAVVLREKAVQKFDMLKCDEEAVIWAIRLFLGREPTIDEIALHLKNGTFESLRQAFLKTKEFDIQLRKIRPKDSTFKVPLFLLPSIDDMLEVPGKAARVFRAPSIADPTCQLCTYGQFLEKPFLSWLEELKFLPSTHRKIWEFVFILAAMKKIGVLSPGKKALGFGTGKERIPSLLTKYGLYVTASDAPPELDVSKQWNSTNQHSGQLADLFFSDIVEESVFNALASWLPIDMNSIPAEVTGFDVCWSACAFEHLGSLQHGKQFVFQSLNTLVPGGFAIHTTEFNLTSNEQTFESPGLSVFRKIDIENIADELTAAGHTVWPLNFHPGERELDEFVDLPPWSSVHLKLELHNYTCTSIGLVIQKGATCRK